jgi:NTP pyrophosphatase (non-canonical NTP hydrolase)
VAAELGDVLWYIAALSRDLNISLNDVAKMNIEKLADRKERGVLGGSGDNR